MAAAATVRAMTRSRASTVVVTSRCRSGPCTRSSACRSSRNAGAASGHGAHRRPVTTAAATTTATAGRDAVATQPQTAMAPDAQLAAELLGLLGPASAGTTVRRRDTGSILLAIPARARHHSHSHRATAVYTSVSPSVTSRQWRLCTPRDFLCVAGHKRHSPQPPQRTRSPCPATCGRGAFSRYADHMALHTRGRRNCRTIASCAQQ